MPGQLIDRAQGLYYSSHHFTRDVFLNSGNLLLFLALGTILSDKIRALTAPIIELLKTQSETSARIGVALVFIAIGSVFGSLLNHLSSFIFALLPARCKSLLAYEATYEGNKDQLLAISKRIFHKIPDLQFDGFKNGMDLIVRLTSFMRLYNPSGYVHVFRTYSLVSLHKQAIVYSFLLAVTGMFSSTYSAIVIPLVILILLLLSLPGAIRFSVIREYAYISATSQWILEQRIPATVQPQPPASSLPIPPQPPEG